MPDKKQNKLTLSIAIRSIIFNCFFYTSFTFFIIFIVFPLSLLKSPKPMRSAILAMIKSNIYMFENVANIKIEERGLENIPKNKGFIYGGKHMSNIDAYIVYRRSPNLTAMAKKELYRVPLIGPVLNKMGVLAINRGAGEAQKQTAAFAKILVDKKLPMVMFSEGTRIMPGEYKPLKSGAFYYQQEADLDVIVISQNSGIFWRKNSWIKWPGTVVFEYHPPMPKGLSKQEFMAELERRTVDRSNELMLL